MCMLSLSFRFLFCFGFAYLLHAFVCVLQSANKHRQRQHFISCHGTCSTNTHKHTYVHTHTHAHNTQTHVQVNLDTTTTVYSLTLGSVTLNCAVPHTLTLASSLTSTTGNTHAGTLTHTLAPAGQTNSHRNRTTQAWTNDNAHTRGANRNAHTEADIDAHSHRASEADRLWKSHYHCQPARRCVCVCLCMGMCAYVRMYVCHCAYVCCVRMCMSLIYVCVCFSVCVSVCDVCFCVGDTSTLSGTFTSISWNVVLASGAKNTSFNSFSVLVRACASI